MHLCRMGAANKSVRLGRSDLYFAHKRCDSDFESKDKGLSCHNKNARVDKR